MRRGSVNDTQTLRHIAVQKGILVETTSEVTENTYTVTNAADETRAVVVEHARQSGAELDSDVKPEETTATSYRFRVAVQPHQFRGPALGTDRKSKSSPLAWHRNRRTTLSRAQPPRRRALVTV